MELLIHPKFYFLCLLMLPALLVRAAVFHGSAPVKAKWANYGLSLIGVVQDLFMGWQAIFLIILLNTFIPFAFPFLFWVLSLGYFFIQIDMVFDAVLYKRTLMRLDVSFFAFMGDLRSFWDSIKTRGIFGFVVMGTFLGMINMSMITFLQNHLEAFKLSEFSMVMGAILGPTAVLSHLLMPRRLTYSTSNALLIQQIWLIRKGCSGIRWAIKLSKGFLMPNKQLFFNEQEHFSLLTPKYPILKFTHGFHGPKQCDVFVKEEERPHVVFLFMESWRAKDVSAFGGKYPITPHFDSMAKEGIVFKNFYSNSVKTSRAVTASLFGIPSDVETMDASREPEFPIISVADVLKKAGYTNNYFLASHLDFEKQRGCLAAHGFDNLVGKAEILKSNPSAKSTSWGVHDEHLMNYAIDHLDQNRDEPQFLSLFTISNHHPWIYPPGPHCKLALPEFKNANYGRYLRSFHYSDACLGLFKQQLEEKGLIDNTILFILGDHGQPMGEHHGAQVNHLGLYEENIHVPFLIYAPGRIKQPAVIDQIGSQLDLFPTLMDMLNLKGLNHTVGSSLLREKRDKKVFFHNPYVHGYFGCRYNNYKLIHTRAIKQIELYDLSSDPKERINIAREHPELVEELLSDVRCYENFFTHLYRERMIRPAVLDSLNLSRFDRA